MEPGAAAASLERLEALLPSRGRVLIAYSGGVDSAVLAAVARRVLASSSASVLVRSESLASREIADAAANAEAMGIPLRIVDHAELADPSYAANPANRCYFCRRGLSEVLGDIAQAEGFDAVAVGTVTDDLADWRPGTKALREGGVWQPYLDLGFSKADVRAIAHLLELPVADKPSMACLSSRIPYGDPVTYQKLRRIEAGEEILRSRGFRQVRVRHFGEIARIEVLPDEIARLEGMLTEVRPLFAAVGYPELEIDSRGYRTGSLNEALSLTLRTQSA